jgi:Dolichyl-phosphate-mannose-protein mannosyltransferase
MYGLFIDELYFLACGEHLDWGYVDAPPLTAFQAWLARAMFGDSLLAIRLFPAIAGAALVVLTALLTRALAGGRFAQFLAALAVAIAPIDLAFNSYLSMNSIEPLIWIGCAMLLVRMIRTGDTRLWVPFGALAGIGLLNKHTMLMFGFAVGVGLVVTRERRLLASRWLFVGAAIAFAIFLPNLIWNFRHHFPMLELLANIRKDGRDIPFRPLQFLALQAFFENPVALPIWLAGLYRLLGSAKGRPYRALGIVYLVMLGILLARGKPYYLSPVYPMLFAAGAVSVEEWRTSPARRRTALAYAVVIFVAGSLLAPTLVPILQPETYIRYTRALHIGQPRLENRAASALPQFFADRFGWPEMVQTVARVYHALPPEEQRRTGIFGNDYGQAGAIDFYGPALGLPKSIGAHLTYWYWGPREYTGESLIVLGDDRETLETEFGSVREVAQVGHPYAMRQEHFGVFLCRQPKGWTLRSLWPRLKRFD